MKAKSAFLLMMLVLAANATAATHTVDIVDGAFNPTNLTIKQGDTVKWVWIRPGHSTTRTNALEPWDSGIRFTTPSEFSHTFITVGTFPYVCTPHASLGMTGSIIVESAMSDTTTALGSSQNPSPAGSNVTFTATVSVVGGGAGVPMGSVTFYDDVTELCGAVALSGNSATCMTSSLSPGTHPITADYSGDASFNGSLSPTLNQVINTPPPVPAFLNATATSNATVALSWGGTTGATGYDVYRSFNASPFSLLLMTAATSAEDSGLTADTTYLYRVRATGAGGASSFTPTDAATTIVFTDATLTGEIVKAVHVSELRTAVNAMRAAGNQPPLEFTDVPLAGVAVKAVHIAELRTALNAARSMIALPAITFADPTLTPESTIISAIHATELRAGTQ